MALLLLGGVKRAREEAFDDDGEEADLAELARAQAGVAGAYLAMALDEVSSGDYASARESFDRALRKDSTDAVVQLAEYAEGEDEDLVVMALTLLAQYERNAEVLHEIANGLVQRRMYLRAMRFAEAAAKLGSQDALGKLPVLFWHMAATELIKKGAYDKAIPLLMQASLRGNWRSALGLAGIYILRGEMSVAVEALDLATSDGANLLDEPWGSVALQRFEPAMRRSRSPKTLKAYQQLLARAGRVDDRQRLLERMAVQRIPGAMMPLYFLYRERADSTPDRSERAEYLRLMLDNLPPDRSPARDAEERSLRYQLLNLREMGPPS